MCIESTDAWVVNDYTRHHKCNDDDEFSNESRNEIKRSGSYIDALSTDAGTILYCVFYCIMEERKFYWKIGCKRKS